MSNIVWTLNVLLKQFIAGILTTDGPIHRGPPAPGAREDPHATTDCVDVKCYEMVIHATTNCVGNPKVSMIQYLLIR